MLGRCVRHLFAHARLRARCAAELSRRARTTPTDALRPAAQADALTAPPTHGCSRDISGAFKPPLRVDARRSVRAARATARLRVTRRLSKPSTLYQPRPCLALPPRLRAQDGRHACLVRGAGYLTIESEEGRKKRGKGRRGTLGIYIGDSAVSLVLSMMCRM